jgi:ferredoxin-NADP reductase/ferredoxin
MDSGHFNSAERMTTTNNDSIIHYHGERYTAAPDETLLEALLRQGAPVAHSCGKGSCHTCVLRLEQGNVTHGKPIDATIGDSGHVLPCVAHAHGETWLAPPEMARISIDAEILSRRELGGGIFEIGLAPLKEMHYAGGQHLQVLRIDGLSRSYSIASLPTDDFMLYIHVRRIATGGMSQWLCEQAAIGEHVNLLAPTGDCHYRADMAQRELLLLATGSGAGAMHAVARDALASGHTGAITLYHGVRSAHELYLQQALLELSQRHANFRYVPCLSGKRGADWPDDVFAGRVTAAAFAANADLANTEVFLCGSPLMVEDARCLAVAAGAQRERIHVDPFDRNEPPMPRDSQKVAQFVADTQMWQALEHGPRMRRILETFYEYVYADARLSPFFDGIPRRQVIDKQYGFLADLFSGKREYFGLKPYNAHHWMVISDELFDYREALFERVLREHELPEPLIHRWLALHERFRVEIVKPVARGIILDGKELPLHTHQVDRLDMDTICDGCGEEILAGRPVRYQFRLGTLHCEHCAGLAASE